MLIVPTNKPHGHVCNCLLALLPPLHLTEIDGPSSSGPFIWASRQSQWNSRKGPGPVASLQRARRSQIYRTSWEWLYLWTEKWEQKSQNEDGGRRKRKHPFLSHFPLPSFESHSLCPSISSFLPPRSLFNPISISQWAFWECLVLLLHLCCSSKRQSANYPVHDT